MLSTCGLELGSPVIHSVFDTDDVALKSANKTANSAIESTTNFDYDASDHASKQV